MKLDCSKKYILVRDDIPSPEGVVTVQMSSDIVQILADALKGKDNLGMGDLQFLSPQIKKIAKA